MENRDTKTARVGKTACELGSRILQWEYSCGSCQATFQVDVPRGPTQEKAIRCLNCGGDKIQRINMPDLSGPACGG